jgi:hypothetical protein
MGDHGPPRNIFFQEARMVAYIFLLGAILFAPGVDIFVKAGAVAVFFIAIAWPRR